MQWMIALLLLGLVVGIPIFAYAWFVEPNRPRLRRETLELDDLPPGLDGLTILHLSDFHLRAGDTRRADIIRQVSGVEADLVALTGDFIEGDEDVEFCTRSLQHLKARYGIFAVLGNHDYLGDRSFFHSLLKIGRRRNNVGRLVRKLEATGIKFLINESRALSVDGHRLWLVGVDDPHYRRHDLNRALRNVPPGGFRILLAHSPDVVEQLSYHRADLTLSGHTHGGQIVFPGLGALVTRTRYPVRPASGWHRVGKGWMHVSKGLGASLPVRFRCSPEANLIELKARARVPVPSLKASEIHQR